MHNTVRSTDQPQNFQNSSGLGERNFKISYFTKYPARKIGITMIKIIVITVIVNADTY